MTQFGSPLLLLLLVGAVLDATPRAWAAAGESQAAAVREQRDREDLVMRYLLFVAPVVLVALLGLAVMKRDAEGQSEPDISRASTSETTALTVSAIHDPLWATGSDGLAHLEYDLVITNVFTSPVGLSSVEVLTTEGVTLHRLEGDTLAAVTQPMIGRTPMDHVPVSSGVTVLLDVAVPPDQVPASVTHRISYELAPDAPLATIVGSRVISGPELRVDPGAPLVIAPPLRGEGWINFNGCCGASPHRSARLAVDGSRLVQPETFAIDWIRLGHGGNFDGDGTRNDQYYAFGAELLAVADGTVVYVRDGMPEGVPNQAQPPATVKQPGDFGGNQVVVQVGPAAYANYAHLQPGSLRVQVGDKVTTGQVLALLGHTGNSSEAHLHFAILDGPDGLTANSLPFVIDRYTVAGTVSLETGAVEGDPTAQVATLPLELTVADFR